MTEGFSPAAGAAGAVGATGADGGFVVGAGLGACAQITPENSDTATAVKRALCRKNVIIILFVIAPDLDYFRGALAGEVEGLALGPLLRVRPHRPDFDSF
jgi:hypothetical protein